MRILKRIKIRWLVLALLPLMAIVGFVAGHAILRSQLNSQLAAALGSEPEIGSVSIGLRWHSAENIVVRNAATNSPWLTIDRLYLHLPLWEALRGNLKPHQVIVDGPSVDVHLDEHGQPIGISDLASPPTELPSDQIDIRLRELPFINLIVAQSQPTRSMARSITIPTVFLPRQRSRSCLADRGS